MGFADRLSQDVDKVFLGADNFEEDLVLTKGKDHTSLNLKGVVDVISYNTGGLAENEVNPSMMALADVFIKASDLGSYEPDLYDKIAQSTGLNWSVKQKSFENGMWTLRCTDRETRRRR